MLFISTIDSVICWNSCFIFISGEGCWWCYQWAECYNEVYSSRWKSDHLCETEQCQSSCGSCDDRHQSELETDCEIFETKHGCRFPLAPYDTTGRIDVCDRTNHRYVITFPSVTADHIGVYSINAPDQKPVRSERITIRALTPPVISPASVSVIAGESTNLTCTVNKEMLATNLTWRKILPNGDKVVPANGGQSHMKCPSECRYHCGPCTLWNKLIWDSDGRHDRIIVFRHYFPHWNKNSCVILFNRI